MTDIPRFTGDASPYGGGDPYADYRTADFPFMVYADLADRRLGAGVVAANDEFFAERENLLKPEPAHFDPEAFGHKGKIMDGWETRRRRGASADHPWPTAEDLHAEASATLPAYTGVVSWHALPLLLDAMAMAVGPAVGRGAHLLVTAPDPGPHTAPENLLFLREVAEALENRLPLSSRSIAWRGTSRTPTAESALASVVEAHGRREQRIRPRAAATPPAGRPHRPRRFAKRRPTPRSGRTLVLGPYPPGSSIR